MLYFAGVVPDNSIYSYGNILPFRGARAEVINRVFMKRSCASGRLPLLSPQQGQAWSPRMATVAFEGIEARAVDVQVQVAPGLLAFGLMLCQ
jgi:hypothetical protein